MDGRVLETLTDLYPVSLETLARLGWGRAPILIQNTCSYIDEFFINNRTNACVCVCESVCASVCVIASVCVLCVYKDMWVRV